MQMQNESAGGLEGPLLFDNSVWNYLAATVVNSSALLREAAKKIEQIEMAVAAI